MNPWGQPQQPYNPAMAAYYQQQQQAAYGAYPQQQYQAQPQYQPVPGYPPQPQYPYAQPGYAYPPQQTYGAAPAYYPQPVVPAAPVAAPPAPPAPAPAPVAVELPEGAKAPMNVFVGKLPLDVHESCVEALLKQCGGVLKWKRSVGDNNVPKAFGFCTFSDAQGALAAVELLNEFDLKGQKIQVKTGQKEQAILDDLITKRRALTSAATQTYSSPPGGVQRTPADEEKLSRLRTFVSTIDTTKPVPAAALASLMPNAPAPGSKEQMIAEEMEKFREKQAQRDKELEDERRRKLQAKVQEAQALEKTISASLDSAKKRTLGMKGGPEKRPKLETPAATALAPNAPKLGFSLGGAPAPPRGFKPGLATSAFGAEEASKPRVLQKLDDDESAAPAPSLSDNQSSARAATDEDAKKRDRAIAEAIPTDADQLFKATVDWAAVERAGVVQAKLRPWVAKKIAEYLGEEEPTLINYICSCLGRRAKPEEIRDELALVLDEDAQTMVVKLWRVLLFHAAKAAQRPSA
uniref:PWI domain-containing protein n=1 Tax=Pelagomonas calceolata TaxID=35677 RepID=A0A7S3ZNA8_9STRA|mmetsp:Transcript_18178/g.51788  ORF Transcript_18178/g.51788 Transcript_18178/m.51788 type:complete len:520 (+) Transcript_18178:291-1850(+)